VYTQGGVYARYNMAGMYLLVYARVYHPGYTIPAHRLRCTPGYTVTHRGVARERGPGLYFKIN